MPKYKCRIKGCRGSADFYSEGTFVCSQHRGERKAITKTQKLHIREALERVSQRKLRVRCSGKAFILEEPKAGEDKGKVQ